MSDLQTAFRFHRLLGKPATRALALARQDVAGGKTRYASSDIFPAVSWQDEQIGNLPFPQYKRRIAHVQTPAKAGLRLVGRVNAEPGHRNGYWDKHERSGWFTYPDGTTYKDGSGLCYGVVYQLPGRNGKSRFVAGFEFGGVDGGPTLELGRIFESEAPGNSWDVNPCDYEGAREAARYADDMARVAGEKEREYQTAWQAGSRFADIRSEMQSDKRQLREILAERRAVKGKGDYPALCLAIRSTVLALVKRISKARATMQKLKGGDFVSESYPGFFPSAELQAAFNEGADI